MPFGIQALFCKLLLPHKLPSNGELFESMLVVDLATLMPVVLMNKVLGELLQAPATGVVREAYSFAKFPFHQ